MGKLRRDLPGDVLASECAAYLNGTLAELWEERGTSVPVWTWTNLLAHGSEGQMHESLLQPVRPRRTGRSWRIARSFLAHQVLDLVSDISLEELQSTVLLPLELELAARRDVEQWTPRRWAETVDAAIRSTHSTLDF
jgi:hypothetical protein